MHECCLLHRRRDPERFGVGISLTTTMSPTFDQMFIFNSSSDGVGGTDVTNFTFTDGRIDNSGTGGGVDTSNIGFNNTAAGTENNLDGVVDDHAATR